MSKSPKITKSEVTKTPVKKKESKKPVLYSNAKKPTDRKKA
jgi:hypothetical protein